MDWVERALAASMVSTATDLRDALVSASFAGRVDVITRLLAAGASPSGNEALQLASENGHTDAVARLLADGAGEPTQLASALWSAVEAGRDAVAAVLLGAGADGHSSHREILRTASAKGLVGTVEALLLDSADPARHDAALRAASENGHVAVVELLLRVGADVHTDDDYALRHASKNGHVAVAALLLQAGADVHAEDDQALRWAGSEGRTAAVELLLHAGADVHSDRDYAIRMASAHGHVDATARLLAAAADVRRIEWTAKLDRLAQLRILVGLPRTQFLDLSRARRALWLRVLLPPITRLRRALHRVRARLDRPPTEPHGTATPTREALIAHLRTGGKRFARDYWVEGIPIFFPALEVELGPLPECFMHNIERA